MTSSGVKVIAATVLTLLSALPLAAVELDVTGFTDVALIDVDGYTMERADEHRVEATGDIAELKIIRLGSWLIIDASDASAVRIDIAMPDLFHLQLEKCGPGIVTGFRAQHWARIEGRRSERVWVDHAATELTVLLDKGALSGTLVADVVTVRMEDSAVTLSGGVSRLTLSARGDSEVGIDHLRGSRVVLELHDDAVARVRATSSQLNYRVHGAAELYYDAATELGSVRERNGNAEVRVEELEGG